MTNQSWVSRVSAVMAVAILAASSALLSGCGGDDAAPAPNPNANPTGYYINTGDARVNADTMMPMDITDLQGMVTRTQLIMFSDTDNVAYVGTISVSVNSFSGTVTVYEAGIATQSNVSVSGTVAAGVSITGSLEGTGLGNGSFTLNYAPENTAADLSLIINTLDWFAVTNSEHISFSVNAQLAPALNLTTGGQGIGAFESCSFRGRIDSIAGTHLYTIEGTMTNCTDTDIFGTPTYTGLASVRGTDPSDRFMLSITNGSYGMTGEFQR